MACWVLYAGHRDITARPALVQGLASIPDLNPFQVFGATR
jgi:hypothetical protein